MRPPGQRPGAPGGPRFNRRDYQFNRNASRRFHGPTWVRPPGWFARRWAFGQILPSLFWTPQFRISNYWLYDLPVPPWGYEWVRNGPDALLVDIRTGMILQVIYGLFY